MPRCIRLLITCDGGRNSSRASSSANTATDLGTFTTVTTTGLLYWGYFTFKKMAVALHIGPLDPLASCIRHSSFFQSLALNRVEAGSGNCLRNSLLMSGIP